MRKRSPQPAGAVHASGAAQQDSRARRAGYDVEHPVQAVDEIDIERARRTKHHFGPCGTSAGRMAGEVVRPEIGFRLGYDEVPVACAPMRAQERLAEEVARDLVRRPVKESRLKNCARARCGRRTSWLHGKTSARES